MRVYAVLVFVLGTTMENAVAHPLKPPERCLQRLKSVPSTFMARLLDYINELKILKNNSA